MPLPVSSPFYAGCVAIRGTPRDKLDDEAVVEALLCRAGFNTELLHEQPDVVRQFGGGFRIWQYPCQFAPYLCWLADTVAPRSYLEVGSRWGGTFAFTVEYLARRGGAPLRRAVAVDIEPFGDLVAYCAAINGSETATAAAFVCADSHGAAFRAFVDDAAAAPCGRFDVALIDGDHTYDGVRRDYELVRRCADVLMFHDIASPDACPGVVRFWRELSDGAHGGNEYVLQQFCDQYGDVCKRTGGKTYLGIGVAVPRDQWLRRRRADDAQAMAEITSQRRECNVYPSLDVLPRPVTSYDAVVVGAGLSGIVIAERLANVDGKRVLVVDRRAYVGGNCHDYIDAETGVLVSAHGAHLFHTKRETVWQYVNQFGIAWQPYEHRVVARVPTGRDGDGTITVPMPPNFTTVRLLCADGAAAAEFDAAAYLDAEQRRHQLATPARNAEEEIVSRAGRRLFDLLYRDYTQKQWGRAPSDLAPEVGRRVAVRRSDDDRYFDDRWQALPEGGYTRFCAAVLASAGARIDVVLGVDALTDARLADIVVRRERSPPDDDDVAARQPLVVFTGPIDAYYRCAALPPLEYRTIRFDVTRHLDDDDAPAAATTTTCHQQEAFVVNYPSLDVPWTRSVEYRHLKHQFSLAEQQAPDFAARERRLRRGTVVARETTTDDGSDPHYPVPSQRNADLYALYRLLAERDTLRRGVHFVGRLARYQYYNMDDAIDAALQYHARCLATAAPALTPTPSLRVAFVTAIVGPRELQARRHAPQQQQQKRGIDTVPPFTVDTIVYTDRPAALAGREHYTRVIDAAPYAFGLDATLDCDAGYNGLRHNTHPFMRAKFFKCNAQRLPELADYDVVVWLDGSVEVHGDAYAAMVLRALRTRPLVAWTHNDESRRGLLRAEVSASHMPRYDSAVWLGYPQPVQRLDQQYARFVAEGFRERWFDGGGGDGAAKTHRHGGNTGVWWTGAVAFDMRSPLVRNEFLPLWWRETVTGSTQDQVGFPYACWRLRVLPACPELDCGFARGRTTAQTFDNEFLRQHVHGTGAGT